RPASAASAGPPRGGRCPARCPAGRILPGASQLSLPTFFVTSPLRLIRGNGVPDPHGRTHRRGAQKPTVLAERQTSKGIAGSAKRENLLACRRIPEPDGLPRACRGKALAIRRKCDGANRVLKRAHFGAGP